MPNNFRSPKRHRCPLCKHVGVLVTDKRNRYASDPLWDTSRRRRQCQACSHKWSTVELHSKFHDIINKVERELVKRAKSKTATKTSAQDAQREKLRASVQEIENRSK